MPFFGLQNKLQSRIRFLFLLMIEKERIFVYHPIMSNWLEKSLKFLEKMSQQGMLLIIVLRNFVSFLLYCG